MRFKNLIQLGIPLEQALQRANSRKGYWHVAGSLILTTTMNNRYFETLGFPNILERYSKIKKRKY